MDITYIRAKEYRYCSAGLLSLHCPFVVVYQCKYIWEFFWTISLSIIYRWPLSVRHTSIFIGLFFIQNIINVHIYIIIIIRHLWIYIYIYICNKRVWDRARVCVPLCRKEHFCNTQINSSIKYLNMIMILPRYVSYNNQTTKYQRGT